MNEIIGRVAPRWLDVREIVLTISFTSMNRAVAPEASPRIAKTSWSHGLWLPVVAIVLLTLAFAPFGQFYLAWVGLTPWLLYVVRARSWPVAFFFSWIFGTLFFFANIWWILPVTIGGTAALCVYSGLYWGIALLFARPLFAAPNASSGTFSPGRALISVVLFGAIWTGLEWIRGNLMTGFPWSFLGYTQTPLLPLCQIADVTGVYGVSFLLAAANAIALLMIVRPQRRQLIPACVVIGALLATSIIYGLLRMAGPTTPGPRLLVIQSNFPQSNGGAKGAEEEDFAAYHLDHTRQALDAAAARRQPIDLIVWSETTMPPLNPAAREFFRSYKYGEFIDQTYNAICNLARSSHAAVLAGGVYYDQFRTDSGRIIPLGRRNTAYFFDRSGVLSDARYDKIHLVPFGETIPFRTSVPWLYNLLLKLSPYDYDYTVQPGEYDALTVFSLAMSDADGKSVAFVTPICFEDADPRLVSRMFRSDLAGAKRAQFIVNITNDGWFYQPQLSQHLQIARFRSIENRVPTARAVNTGISAFIDSSGRIIERLPGNVDGSLTHAIPLDPRVSFYTRFGDWFAGLCTIVTAVVAIGCLIDWRRRRRHRFDSTAPDVR